jgi:hypothetical protein
MTQEFIARDRIGPLEHGPRAGEYIEAGALAFAGDFASDENIQQLIAVGVLEAIPHLLIAEDTNGNGTHDSNGN